MPLLRQMFPSRYLQPEDLPTGITSVTIHAVRPIEARSDRGAFDEDPEVTWAMRVAEYRKPIKLKSALARSIAGTLGTENTDEWIGQVIGIFPTQIIAYGKQIPVIACDVARPNVGSRLPGSNAGLASMAGTLKIPVASMNRAIASLTSAGKSWDDLLRLAKRKFPDHHDLMVGCDMDQMPLAVMRTIKALLNELIPTAKTEQINTATGEVTAAPVAVKAPAPATPAIPADPVPPRPSSVVKPPLVAISDDEIPF